MRYFDENYRFVVPEDSTPLETSLCGLLAARSNPDSDPRENAEHLLATAAAGAFYGMDRLLDGVSFDWLHSAAAAGREEGLEILKKEMEAAQLSNLNFDRDLRISDIIPGWDDRDPNAKNSVNCELLFRHALAERSLEVVDVFQFDVRELVRTIDREELARAERGGAIPDLDAEEDPDYGPSL